MEKEPEERAVLFDEAFETLSGAIESAVRMSRISVHPFASLLSGVGRYVELGGRLTTHQGVTVDRYRGEARSRFSGDALMGDVLNRLDALL
jgi:hypothetical protein